MHHMSCRDFSSSLSHNKGFTEQVCIPLQIHNLSSEDCKIHHMETRSGSVQPEQSALGTLTLDVLCQELQISNLETTLQLPNLC
jgi:hypothetical protein